MTGDTRAASWSAAVLRAFSPPRLLLCAGGLAASLLFCSLIVAQLAEEPLRVEAWWQHPVEELRRLGEVVFAQGTMLLRPLLWAAVLSVVWGLAGGWIARAELLHQRGHDVGEGTDRATPTRFVFGRAKALCLMLPICLFVVAFCLLLGILAGVFNRIPFVGALLVSVGLPTVMVGCLIAAVVLVGTLSFSIMPSAIAAEGTDNFDAISRSYSYLFQRTLLFAWWWGVAVAIAALPTAAVVLLVTSRPGAVGADIEPLLWAAGAVLSLSLFWTLQALVYLKMRRAVDEVSEDEVWDGPLEDGVPERPRPAAAGPAPPGTGESDGQEEKKEEPVEAPAPPPRQGPFTFRDTLRAGADLHAPMQLLLMVAVVWAGLVLLVGARVTQQVAPGPRQEFSVEEVRASVLRLADQQPGALAAVAVGVLLVAATAVGRLGKAAARMGAVRLVYGQNVGVAVSTGFGRRTRGRGLLGVLLLSAGILLLLAAGCLLPLALRGAAPWEEVATLTVASVVLVGLASLGLGVLAVEGGRDEYAEAGGGVGALFANGPETLASAAANLVLCPVRFALVLAVLGLAWFLTCESIAWSGGENVRWLRWGLDGALVPDTEPGPYRVASWVVGLWFFLPLGLVLVYPIASALCWGTACYLAARTKGGEQRTASLELSEEERAAMRAGQRGRQRMIERVEQTRSRLRERNG